MEHSVKDAEEKCGEVVGTFKRQKNCEESDLIGSFGTGSLLLVWSGLERLSVSSSRVD